MKIWIFVFLEIPGGLSAPALSPRGSTRHVHSHFAHARRLGAGPPLVCLLGLSLWHPVIACRVILPLLVSKLMVTVCWIPT